MHLFNRIKFSTPESIELEFTLAGRGSRAWVLIIDYNILGLSLAMLIFVWGSISAQLIYIGLRDSWNRLRFMDDCDRTLESILNLHRLFCPF